jgi:hypothetical protein
MHPIFYAKLQFVHNFGQKKKNFMCCTYRCDKQRDAYVNGVHNAGLEQDSTVHPHFLGGFGPNQPEEQQIHRNAKKVHHPRTPGMQRGN